jgi:hypothetical protein
MLPATRGWFDFLIDEGASHHIFANAKGLVSLILMDRKQQLIQLVQQGTRVESSDGNTPEELSYSLK